MPVVPTWSRVRFVARARSLSASRARAALLATGVIPVALMLSPGVANAADQYNVKITNIYSRLKIDVMWASTAPYQGVFLWPNNASASQTFDLLDSGGGYFRIRARHSGQCLMLDWRSGSYTNGTPIIQYPYCNAGYSPAEWRRGWVSSPPTCNGDTCTITDDAYPVLINRATGRCLDAANGRGGAPPMQAVLQQWDCLRTPEDWNASNQGWQIGNEATL